MDGWIEWVGEVVDIELKEGAELILFIHIP